MGSIDHSLLSTEQKIGQLFFIGISGSDLDERTTELIDRIRPGGVCLFARNIRDAVQTRQLLDAVRDRSEIVPFLSLDQEGGLVDRLRRVVGPMPAANRIRTVSQSERFGLIVAETIRLLGFNMDFAPVVDVIDDSRSSVSNGLHSRAFGKDATQTSDLAQAFICGLTKGGVKGCLKHFPGLGASVVDSHEDLPAVPISSGELWSTDLMPYRKLLSNKGFDGAVMVAHAAFPRSDLQETGQDGKLLPSSLSFNFVSKLLRQELGFDGLTITDDLEMGAVTKNFGIGEACRMAILAGEDMLAICADADAIMEGHRAITSAVKSGSISEDRLDTTLRRIAKSKETLAEPLQFDPERLTALSNEIADFTATLN